MIRVVLIELDAELELEREWPDDPECYFEELLVAEHFAIEVAYRGLQDGRRIRADFIETRTGAVVHEHGYLRQVQTWN